MSISKTPFFFLPNEIKYTSIMLLCSIAFFIENNFLGMICAVSVDPVFAALAQVSSVVIIMHTAHDSLN